MNDQLLLILGMAAVTLAARLAPVLFSGRREAPSWLTAWLEAVPFAALGALIVPGIVLADGATPWVGIGAALAAVLVSLLRAPAYVAALAAVAAAFMVKPWL